MANGRRVKPVNANWSVGDRNEIKELILNNVHSGKFQSFESSQGRIIPPSLNANSSQNTNNNDNQANNIRSNSDGGNTDLLDAHGYVWKLEHVAHSINGVVTQRPWKAHAANGTIVSEGSADIEMEPVEYS